MWRTQARLDQNYIVENSIEIVFRFFFLNARLLCAVPYCCEGILGRTQPVYSQGQLADWLLLLLLLLNYNFYKVKKL